MKNRYLATFASVALAAFAAFGFDADGNIRSIDAVPVTAQSIMFPNASAPLQVGQQVYILVRLLNADWDDAAGVGSELHPWYFKKSKYAMSDAMSIVNLPALGISVGGASRQAVYTTKGPNGEESGANPTIKWYTDLYFVYTVQPGDIGLPIKLLNKNGQIPQTEGDNADYLLYNVNTAGAEKYAAWDLTTDAEVEVEGEMVHPLVQFHYGPENPSAGGGAITPGYPAWPHTAAHRSFDLASEGIYIRTLDFDNDYADKDAQIWREVQLGTDEPYTVEATVVGAVTGAVVYVWSESEAVVEPAERGDAKFYDDGTGRKVLQVTVKDGKGVFGLKGKGTVGATTQIYMSAATSEGYSKVGDKLANSACVRTVVVREAPLPHLTICNYSEQTKFDVQAVADYEGTPTVMKVMASERFGAEAFKITLNPQFYRGGTPVDLAEIHPVDGEYVRILTEQNDPLVTEGVKEIEIPAGTAREQIFYLYALGAPADKSINKLVLNPSIDDPALWEKYMDGANRAATITLTDQAPVILEPNVGAVYNTFDGDTIPDFSVRITDNWRDLQETLNTTGYVVTVSFPNGGGSFTTNEVHFTDGLSVTLPVRAPAEGEYPAVIQVKDPAGHVGTQTVTIKSAHALEAKIVAYTDETLSTEVPSYIFNEGDEVFVRVELSSPAVSPMYAFFLPSNAAATNYVTCANETNGVKIAAGETASAATLVKFTDGTIPFLNASFVPGLKSTEDYAAATAVDYTKTYQPRERTFQVKNVSPIVRAGSMHMGDTYVNNGGKLTTKIPLGSSVTFIASVADASSVDFAGVGDKAIVGIWAVGSQVNEKFVSTNLNGRVSGSIRFTELGEKTISLCLFDKDEVAGLSLADLQEEARNRLQEGKVSYSFVVTVAESERIIILNSDGYETDRIVISETEAKKNANIRLQLSVAPQAAGVAEGSDPIGDANPIKVELTTTVNGTDGHLEFVTNVIELTSGAAKQAAIDVNTLNGGYDTSYEVTARVITSNCSNAFNQAWSDYYASQTVTIDVLNEPPVIGVVKRTNGSLTDVSTNKWAAGEIVSLNWQVKDILPDLTNGNFTLTWSIDPTDASIYPNPYTVATDATYTVSGRLGATTGSYEFAVPDIENQTLTLTVEDGDGGMVTKEWQIYVAPTKRIQVNVLGPSTASETKYASARGLGRGAVGAIGTSVAPLAESFVQTWAYPETAGGAQLVAWGYPAIDPADEKALDKGDMPARAESTAIGVPLSTTGAKYSTTSAGYYNFGGELENFFYRWVVVKAGGQGGGEGAEEIKPSPTYYPLYNSRKNFDLATRGEDKTAGYGTVEVEAIFSKEFLKGDRVGDINADGIPDVVARLYAIGGSGEGELPEDDLARLTSENVDEDYLPTLDRDRFGSLIPGLKDSWVGEHQAFTAKMELRGFHDGLNDALHHIGLGNARLHDDYNSDDLEKRIASRDYSEAEMMAWAETGYAKDWTPENPTDPTMEDTDEDGLPDGYEYYFWYWAHVGNIVDGKLVHLTGERYNPHHPEKGDLITWQEIEKRMNPTVPNGEFGENLDLLDSDNDGLVDTLEYELGTNPFHWDTDGDGLPDGYEVMFTNLDPLKKATDDVHDDGTRNDDGDFMAKMQMKKMTVIGTVNPAETDPNEAGHVIYYATYATIDNDADFAYGDASPGWLVKIETKDGDKTVVKDYMIADGTLEPEKVFRSVENGSTTNYYLAADFRRTEVFEAGATNENSNAAMVRGVGVQLMQGTPLNAEPEQTTWCEKKLERQLVGNDEVFLDRSYAVWVYGKKGDFVLAANADIPEHAIVVDGPKTADVTLLHHHVYQRRGFYFEAEEMEPDNTIILGETSLITEAKGGGLVRGRDMGFGFNPLTAWNILPNGYVGARYVRTPKPYPQTVITASAGKPVDTEGYSLMDEFLLMNYRLRTGLINADALVVNILAGKTLEKIWGANTTRGCYTEEQLAGAEGGQAKGADTDGDGVPDGWELYVAAGPTTYVPEDEGGDAAANNLFVNKAFYSPNDPNDKSTDADLDPITLRSIGMADGLSLLAEFCGTDSMTAYANCPSVPKTHPYKPKPDSPEWVNKYLPTDPWSNDTDCDGVADGEEGAGTFRYGSPHDNGKYWVSGGGMNPCSWDTDMDGLPDAWEYQYHGIYATPQNRQLLDAIELQDYKRHVNKAVNHVIISAEDGSTNEVVSTDSFFVGGMDATTPDSYTLNDVKSTPQIEPTLQDNKDFDFDGLDPWQEYLTGFIRAFRYDDPLSPWTVPQKDDFIGTDDEYLEALLTGEPLNPLDYTAKNRGGSNPNLVFGKFDAFGAYGSKCRRKWDLAHGLWYFFPDGPNHCLRIPYDEDGNRLIPPFITVPTNVYGLKLMDAGYDSDDLYYESAPTMYATCDPRVKDSDGDGMDDYYELFHGLNPLYGGETGLDLIRSVWTGSKVSATLNYWTVHRRDEARGNSNQAKLYDFACFPWMAGDPQADPDGDDLRNIDEAIQANAESVRTWLHTDPTPLWMTDTSYPGSIVNAYYAFPTSADQMAGDAPTEIEVPGQDDPVTLPTPMRLPYGHRWQLITAYNWAFEENEGYDSDHDGLSDYQEAASKASAQSDPQDEDDPHRRQAMYFPGDKSALQAKVDPIFGAGGTEFFFLEFTAECWVRPEDTTYEQVILERTIKGGASNPGDLRYYRRNFEIGINPAGQFYAAYDHNGTGEPRVIATAQNKASVNTWTHLAATYDGTMLRLYVNGEVVAKQPSTLHPATPALSIITGIDYDIILSTLEWDNRLGHEITNLADENAIIFGASAVEGVLASALTLHPEVTDWSAYGKFYKGFLDEVRIWDGARTDKEIADNFRTRFTAKECLANRKAVFNAWKEGAHRNVDTSETAVKLPAELAYHYTFDGLLAAAAAENVATSPYGFTAAMEVGGKALVARPEGYVNPWWYALPVHSTVYNEYAYIPWIPNTMTHLPHLDGTTCDSTYWSEDYAGFVSAFSIGQKKYDFPRTHEYATVYRPVLTALDHQPTRPMIIAEIEGMTDEAYDAYRFTQRSLANNSTDLLPLGGAYARYCTDLWDDEGATTTWDVTGTDDDNDLLADWWEELVVAGGKDGIVYATVDGDPITVEDLKADTVIKRNGVLMSAIEAFRRDLAGGAVEIGDESYLATTQFRQTVDEDRDGIPDWWEKMYGIDTGSAADADADPDGDGLSNFQEFLITEVFRYANLNPLLPRSDGYTLDYLLKVGELYVGEIFTDHDGMENVWESQYNAPDFVNRYKYDPLEDRDGDGWSNYAEYRAGTDPTLPEKLSIDGYILPEHPTPVVKATLAYNGNKAILAPVVFMAWNEKADPNMQEAPDAIWTLGTTANTESSSSSSGKDQAIAGSANAAATMVTYEKFVGRKPKGEKTYYLTGGAVSEGSFKLAFLDKGYSIVTVNEETRRIVNIQSGRPEEAVWFFHIYDRDGALMMIGNSLYGDAEETTVGSIDYVTGKVTIDFDHPVLCGEDMGELPTTAGNTGNAGNNKIYHYYSLDNGYVRFTWQSTKAGTTAAGTYYLADADKPSDEIPSRGYLREGKASFACFIDDNGDGKYTAGELYGFVRGVDVGWQGAEVAIEVTETSPIFARVDITTGDSDRKLMWGADSGDIDAALVVSNADVLAALEALSGGKYNHVRVVPYLVAGTLNDTAHYTNERAYQQIVNYMPNRIVAEFDVNTETHPYITEADFIKDGKFDIDWDGFASQIADNTEIRDAIGDVTAVKYRLVLGKDGPVGPSGSADTSTVVRAFSTLIERRYEPRGNRTKPSALTLASGQLLTAARPTFQWRLDESTSANGYAASAALFGCSYTAFQIQVADAKTNEKVYDSGVLRAPSRDAQGRFAWQAPLCAGSQTAFDKIFARSGNWKWRVAMYNAKFKPQALDVINGWSEWANFSTAVNEQQEVDDHGYSMIKATVKYAGPEVVLKNCAKTTQSKGIVRVQAFANGDFAGEPAAEALVTDKLALVNTTDHAANAELCGLAPGRWYVRAYVDTNGNHMKDAWESWGYAREAVTVELGKKAPAVELYIDDADTDNDALPDAWEVATYGNLDHENAYVDPKGEIVLATQTYTSITNGTIGLPKNFPSASLEFFRNFDAARLLLGLDPSETTGDSIADIRAAVELNVKPGSVKVTAMEVDAANRRVTFTVVGDLEAATNNLLAPAYAIPQGTQLAVRVWRKSSLVESEWSWLSDYPVTVSTSIETTVTVDVKEELAKSGFYKVEIVKGSEILKK